MNTDDLATTNPIKFLINKDTLKDRERNNWYKRFAGIPDFHQQPWYDRVIVWFEQNRDKHEAFHNVKPEQRIRVFKILASGLWKQSVPIEFYGMIAVRTKHPDGTGWLLADGKSEIIIVKQLSLEL